MHTHIMCHPSTNGSFAIVWLSLLGLVGCFHEGTRAAPPVLEHLYPAGAALGSTVRVKQIGTSDPWPPQVWVSGEGVRFEADEEKGNWKVQVASDANPGPRLVRFYNQEGASTPRYFLVSTTDGTLETEPNQDTTSAQVIGELPSMQHGRLDPSQDTDTYQVHLTRDRTLIARLDAYVLGSTTDALIRILDEDKRVLAWNHDHYYLDPMVTFTPPSTGYYWVQVLGFPYPATSSERLGGGSGYVYRLYLSQHPYLRSADLPGRQSTPEDAVRLNGWNLNHADRASSLQQMDLATPAQQALVNAEAVRMEQEPNNSQQEATLLTGHGRGRIQGRKDQDWFALEAEKDRWYRFEIQSARLGYPSDLVLKLFDETGKELKSDDDGATMGDPGFDWRAPAAKTYFLSVASLTHQAGEAQVYRILCTPKSPTCALSVDSSEFVLSPGSSTRIKVNIRRQYGHDAALIIRGESLPPGVSCASVLADKDQKEIHLDFHATPGTSPSQGPFQIKAVEKDRLHRSHLAGKTTVTTSVNNGVPAGYLDQVYRSIESLWLTVPPRAKPESPPETQPSK